MSCYVLFVDDEPENLAVFEASCADTFSVLVASGADEARVLMQKHEVGVLVTDQRMPGTTGLELLEWARAEYPQTVRMLMTAYSDLTTAIDAINRGRVRRYLRKPWDHDELHATLAEAVDLYKMSAKVREIERRLLETERVYALGVITAGLARELRTPVAATKARITRVREGLKMALSNLTHTNAANAGSLSARLYEADEDLAEALVGLDRTLDVVRGIELPTRQGDAEATDLSEVLRLTLRLMQSEIRSSASLEVDVRPVPEVAGSSAQLAQVVMNLLVNALKSMGGPSGRRKMLCIRLVPDGDFVRLEVGDSGPGIEPQRFHELFDPLAGRGRNRATGLGLAISKTIVEEMGGTMEAENRGTGGTLFRVRLPALKRT
jgi:two-component system NtrC family sensor kinase